MIALNFESSLGSFVVTNKVGSVELNRSIGIYFFKTQIYTLENMHHPVIFLLTIVYKKKKKQSSF